MKLHIIFKISIYLFLWFFLGMILGRMNGIVYSARADEVKVEAVRHLDSFDAGLLSVDQGALPVSIWQNSSFTSYQLIMEEMNGLTRSPTLENWVKRVFLSASHSPIGAEKNDYAFFFTS